MANITQFENVTFTVGGQNPQSKTVQVAFSVNPTTGVGTANASFTYTGTNSGVDTVTAALAAFNYTSNAATVAWQACPSLIAASNVIDVGVVHNGSTNGFNITSPVPYTYTLTVQSLYFNTSKFFNIPGFGQDLGHKQPGQFQNITPQGTYAGTFVTLENSTATIQDGANTSFKMVMLGSFVVKQAGNYTITCGVDDSFILSIGNGATKTSGNIYNPYGQTTGPYSGFPILMASNSTQGNGENQSPSPFTSVINFPAPGIYPFELDYNNAGGPGGNMVLSFNSSTIIIPVALLPVPASPAPGTQNLVLTPTGGSTNLLIQGQSVTLSLVLTATFQTQAFIPLLEGSPGQVYIYNDPLNPTFTFPSYYGNTPDGPSAAVTDFQVTGNNTAWQGQVTLQWNTGLSKFELSYNGSQALSSNQLFPPNVQSTTLTITQDDIAWFNKTSTSYDLFQATSAGGGKFANIPVFYQLNPNYPSGSAVQVSPTMVAADGTAKTFTVTLARPLPPSQNNTVMSVAFSGTQPVSDTATVTPNLATIAGIPNWLVSYTVVATWAVSAVASTSTMTFSFTAPSITYLGTLSGGTIDAFTTKTNYTYLGTSPTTTVTLQASTITQPTNISLTEKNGGVPVATAGIGTSTVITATWVSANNNFQNTIFYITPKSTGVKATLGTVLAGAATITSIGGGKYQAVFALTVSTAAYTNGTQYQFSYLGNCTDGTNVSYVDTNYYNSNNAFVVTGGGGTGCPDITMYVNETKLVEDVDEGDLVDTLPDEYATAFADGLPENVGAAVQDITYGDEICFHFKTENGAAVIVSESTPVPTKESILAYMSGVDAANIKAYASEITTGMHVITNVGNGPEWSPLVEVSNVGERRVARIHCGGRNFAAGVEPGKYIYTHNLVPIKPVK